MRLLMMSLLPMAIALSIAAAFVLQILRSRARERGADPGVGTTPLQWLSLMSPVVVLLALVSLAAGCGVFYVAVYQPLRGYLASRSWVATPCTILRSEVESHVDHDGDTMSRLSIRYAYTVGDRRFEGTRYEFGFDGFSGGIEPKQRIASALPPGTRTTCHVDPDQPDRAVINHNFSWDLAPLIAFCLIFAGAGVGMLAMGVNDARRTMRAIEAANDPMRRP